MSCKRCALTRAVFAIIDVGHLARDLGRVRSYLKSDAPAVRGIGAPCGAGRIRHFDTRTLWLQAHVTQQDCYSHTDLGTKHLDQATLWKHVQAVSCETRDVIHAKLAGHAVA